jgi:hypothetical protein
MNNQIGLRTTMSPVVSQWRAYFAPVNRTTGSPAIFDPAQIRSFDPDAPPAPWIDAGAIANLKRTPQTKLLAVRGGANGAAAAQCRTALDARVEFDFRDWGKLQMAVAGGAEHMNVLVGNGSNSAPSGGTAVPPITVLPGSTATSIVVDAAIVATFNVGDLVAVDVDYSGQTGYVGTGVPGAYVRSGAGLGPDYIRRVTWNVGRVAQTTDAALVLEKPLIGGAPAVNSKLQLVAGFVDREGGSFVQEWSAVFVSQSESGGQVCFYYPRLQCCASATESVTAIADPLRAVMLHSSYVALPYTDVNDGQQIVCCRSYFPAAGSAAY